MAIERIIYQPAIQYFHGDTIYVTVGTILLALPVITFESLRRLNRLQLDYKQQAEANPSPIMVKSKGKTYRLFPSDIQYVESYGDYAHIHLENQTIISRITLKVLDKKLTSFIRIHRSYLVNPDYCRAFNAESILISGHQIPIGRTYKDKVHDTFKNA